MSDLKEQGLIKGFNFADTLEDIPEDKKLNSINFVKASSTGFVTSTQLNNALENKVDKETGKSLSQNDFTNDDKSKVDLISTIGDGTKYLSDDGTYKTLDFDIEDSLTSVATDKALSANQGRVLNEKVENIKLKFNVEEGF